MRQQLLRKSSCRRARAGTSAAARHRSRRSRRGTARTGVPAHPRRGNSRAPARLGRHATIPARSAPALPRGRSRAARAASESAGAARPAPRPGSRWAAAGRRAAAGASAGRRAAAPAIATAAGRQGGGDHPRLAAGVMASCANEAQHPVAPETGDQTVDQIGHRLLLDGPAIELGLVPGSAARRRGTARRTASKPKPGSSGSASVSSRSR